MDASSRGRGDGGDDDLVGLDEGDVLPDDPGEVSREAMNVAFTDAGEIDSPRRPSLRIDP